MTATPTLTRTLNLQIPLLEANDRIAAKNRAEFRRRGIAAFNLVSSPGSGKTTLLGRTVEELGRTVRCACVVGDLETDNDARRLRRPHAQAVQITTGQACHLDAAMVARSLASLELEGVRLLFIENVGNLVCPASFDLGEARRVVLLSAAEGEDKPLKYPPIFKSADIVLVTKIDVAEVLGFDVAAAIGNARRMAPGAEIHALSARTGAGMEAWYDCLRRSLVPAAN